MSLNEIKQIIADWENGMLVGELVKKYNVKHGIIFAITYGHDILSLSPQIIMKRMAYIHNYEIGSDVRTWMEMVR